MKFHSAVAMYKIKNAVVLCKLDTIKNYEKTSIYAHFDNFCPIIPYSSMRRTIPVAFIYKSPFCSNHGVSICVKKKIILNRQESSICYTCLWQYRTIHTEDYKVLRVLLCFCSVVMLLSCNYTCIPRLSFL